MVSDLREAMLLLCGLEALAALYWVVHPMSTWPASSGLRGLTLALLCGNSVLGVAAVSRRSARCALALIGAYAAFVGCLVADFGLSHPSGCRCKRRPE